MSGPRSKFATCHCGEQIIYPCSCAVAHSQPGWRHTGTTYHRCGPDGTGERAAPLDADHDAAEVSR